MFGILKMYRKNHWNCWIVVVEDWKTTLKDNDNEKQNFQKNKKHQELNEHFSYYQLWFKIVKIICCFFCFLFFWRWIGKINLSRSVFFRFISIQFTKQTANRTEEQFIFLVFVFCFVFFLSFRRTTKQIKRLI